MAKTRTKPQVSADTPARKRGGRPRHELTDEERLKVIIAAGMELTIAEMAGWVGMPKRTLERRIQEDAELREWIDEGRAAGRGRFWGTLHKLAEEGNSRAIGILALHYGIKEPVRGVKVTGDPAQPVGVVTNGSSPEAEQRFDAVLGLPSAEQVH